MESAGTYRMTRAGQITIPSVIRQELKIEEGTPLDFYYSDELILLRRKKTPLEIFDELAEVTQKRFKKMGLKKEEVPRIIKEIRNEARSPGH